jgi:predicted pyridoxine 5'-phosphate oxidase superfamily flavin-nucleotide-binding protein
MVAMPEELMDMIRQWHTVPVATAGRDGKPNVAPKSVTVQDPETLVWGELYFLQTYKNLLDNPFASICIWQKNPPFTAYKLNGQVTFHHHDETAAQMDKQVWKGHTPDFAARTEKMAAAIFTVLELYDQTPRPGSAGNRIG